MTKDRFEKLYGGKTMRRTCYKNGDPDETLNGIGKIECHSTYYEFDYTTEKGTKRRSRGDYANVVPDSRGGFLLPFICPFDGFDGFHYIPEEKCDRNKSSS